MRSPAKQPTAHATALEAYRAGDLCAWATHKLTTAGRADELKGASAKRAKTEEATPMVMAIVDSRHPATLVIRQVNSVYLSRSCTS